MPCQQRPLRHRGSHSPPSAAGPAGRVPLGGGGRRTPALSLGRVGAEIACRINGMSSSGGQARTISVPSAETAGGAETLLRAAHGPRHGRPSVSSPDPGLRRPLHGPEHPPGRLLAAMLRHLPAAGRSRPSQSRGCAVRVRSPQDRPPLHRSPLTNLQVSFLSDHAVTKSGVLGTVRRAWLARHAGRPVQFA